MKNKILFISIVIVVMILSIVLFFLERSRTLTSPELPNSPTPTIVIPVTRTPEGKIDINGVETNDFVENALDIDTVGDVYFAENANYQILYMSEYKKFLISVLAQPFDVVRKEAEQDFIRTLGISEAQACTLPVEVTTPYFANPEFSGATYTLSFCN